MNLFDAVGNTLRSLYCGAAGPVATGLSVLGGVYDGFGGEEQGDDLRAAAQLYRSGQQIACNRAPDSIDGEIEPFFEGGQCQGVQYQIFSQWRNIIRTNGVITTDFTTTNTSTGPGPISFERNDIQPPNGLVNRILTYSNGIIGSSASLSGGSANQTFEAESVTLDITRLDGQPDDCGSIPPEAPLYDPAEWTFNPTINYDDDAGNPQVVTPEIVIEPNFLGPGGGLRVPFKINFGPGLDLTGNFDLNTGDLVINGGGNGGSDDYSGPQEEEQEPGEEEELENIVGVRIISTQTGQGVVATEILQSGGNPNIYVPRVATVAFRYRTGISASAWGTDVPVKGLNFVVWAERPALEVKVTPEDGWSVDVRRILEKKQCDC